MNSFGAPAARRENAKTLVRQKTPNFAGQIAVKLRFKGLYQAPNIGKYR
jgi:hypothetical protein